MRDIAAHLLDGDLRRLSIARDGVHPPPPATPIASDRDLVAWLDGLNAEWVGAARRISPRLLVDLLAVTGPQVSAHFASLDPGAPAPFPVSWAGDIESPNWFDIGRDYTERWLHQQQIRDATGRPPLTARRWLGPVLDLFVRALPHGYRDVSSADGTAVSVGIGGDAGGEWMVLREGGRWVLYSGRTETADARVTLSDDTAWRLFSKGLPRAAATERIAIAGNRTLAEPLLGTLAIMG